MAKLGSLDHFNDFVSDQMTPGKYASAEFVALAFGPPLVSDLSVGGRPGEVVIPCGGLQNFSLSQNMAVARIFELGSKRSYMFPGKVVGAVSYGRPYYHGPSLLRFIMAYYSNDATQAGGTFPSLMGNYTYPDAHGVQIPPGYNNLFVNLASDLFTQPHGELVLMKDTDGLIIGSFYLEQCYLPAHSLAVDAQGIIWQEGVQVQFERLVPVKLTNAIPLIMPTWNDAVNSDLFGRMRDTIAQQLSTGMSGSIVAREADQALNTSAL